MAGSDGAGDEDALRHHAPDRRTVDAAARREAEANAGTDARGDAQADARAFQPQETAGVLRNFTGARHGWRVAPPAAFSLMVGPLFLRRNHREIICAEGRSHQAVLVPKVHHWVIGPAVPHGHGLGNLLAADDHFAAPNLSLGPHKFFVLATNRKASEFAAARFEALADVVEADRGFATLDAHRAKGRAGVSDLLAVRDAARGHGQAFAHGPLLRGMDVLLVAHIVDGHGAGVGKNFADELLRFAQLGPSAILRFLLDCMERRELDGEEREVTLAPILAPVADHVGEEPAILLGAAGVGLALIPDRALDRVGDERRDHAVVEFGRLPRRTRWLKLFQVVELLAPLQLRGVFVVACLGLLESRELRGVRVENVALV